MNDTVGWLGLAVSLLLVAVAARISWWQHLGLQRQIWAPCRRARSSNCCWSVPRSP